MIDDDSKSFEALCIFLSTCRNNMNTLTSLNQLNNPKEIMNIVRKLPYKHRYKWHSNAHSISKAGRQVLFSDLVDFVEQQFSIINIPIFCNINDWNVRTPTLTKRKPFSTVVDDEAKHDEKQCTSFITNVLTCIYCKRSNHCLNTCIFYAKKCTKRS